jgi:hypothetical protein
MVIDAKEFAKLAVGSRRRYNRRWPGDLRGAVFVVGFQRGALAGFLDVGGVPNREQAPPGKLGTI